MEGLNQIPQATPSQGRPSGDGTDDEAKHVQEQLMRRDLLSTVLDTAARERLSRIALVSPQRSQQIEGMVLRMAQSGQLRGRITENQLIDLLKQVEEAQGTATAKNTTIVYQRRKDLDDDFDI